VAFALMAIAGAATATAVKPEGLRNRRRANRTSSKFSINGNYITI